MGWFAKRRRDARISGREVLDASTQPTTSPAAPALALQRKPSTRQSNSGPAPSLRRRPSTQRSDDGRHSIDRDRAIHGDASVTGTVSSGVSRRRRLQLRRHKMQHLGRSSREDITALPGSRELNISPHLRPAAQEDADIPYNFYLASASHTSMPNTQGGKLARRSSIKRAADNTALPKRQSTKRRKDEHVREEEIRAMSGPANTGRPRQPTYDSGILRKDTKWIRGGFNRNLERPMSDVSLPLPESLHSSVSGGSDPFSYHLNRLEVFAPRPLIRQSVNGQYASGLNASMWSARADSRATERRAQRKTTPSRDVLNERKTVDELADNLDSSDLRAVLERDQRRRDQKQQKEIEKVKRRLERKAEKQRARDIGETDSPSKRKRKDLEKHLGLGIESPLLSDVEAPKRKKKDLEEHLGDKIVVSRELPRLQTPEDGDAIRKETFVDYRKALQAAGPSPTSPTGPPSATQDDSFHLGTPLDEAILLNIHPAFRPSPAQSPIPSPERAHLPALEASAHERLQRIVTLPVAEREGSPEAIEALPPLPSPPSKDAPASRHNSRRSSKGWTSLFRRVPSLRKEPGRTSSPAEPKSFSNVSRESIARNIASRASFAGGATGVAPVPTRSMSQNEGMPHFARTGSASTVATSRRDRSGTPVRTTSRFREDLPELPSSLTEPRRHSPDLGVSRSTSSALADRRGLSPALPMALDAASGSGPGSAAEDRHRSTGLMSASLASVDSEASWLSGRPVKRSSVRLSARNSVTSSSAADRQIRSTYASQEDLHSADDGMPTRLSVESAKPPSNGSNSNKLGSTVTGGTMKATPDLGPGGAAGEAAEDQNGFRRAGVQKGEDVSVRTGDVGKTPRLVERSTMAKSREGLLNEFRGSVEDITPQSSTVEPSAAERSLPTPEPEEAPESPAAETPLSEKSFALATPSIGEPAVVHRASSVEVNHGHHARQVSAGSAKLLDIPAPRRPSTSHGPSSATSSRAPTPKMVFAMIPPRTEAADVVELTPPPTANALEKSTGEDGEGEAQERSKSDSAAFV